MLSILANRRPAATPASKPPKLLEWSGPYQTPRRSAGMPPEIILVAIEASVKPVSKQAVEWALTNIAQEGDCITLLAIIVTGHSSGAWRLWAQLSRHCSLLTTKWNNSGSAKEAADVKTQINQNWTDMLEQISKRCKAKKVKVTVNIMPLTILKGTVASQAANLKASWVILDSQLKKEEKYCLELLQCSVAVVSRNQAPKILRLKLKKAAETQVVSEQEELDSSSVFLEGLSFSNRPIGIQACPNSTDHPNNTNFELELKLFNGIITAEASPDTSSLSRVLLASNSSTSPLSATSEHLSKHNRVLQNTQQPTSPSDIQAIQKDINYSATAQTFGCITTSQKSSPKAVARISSPKAAAIHHKEQVITGGLQQHNESGSSSTSPEPTAVPAPILRKPTDKFDNGKLDLSAVALKASVLSVQSNQQERFSRTSNTWIKPTSPRLLSHLLNSPITNSWERENLHDADVITNKCPEFEPAYRGDKLHKRSQSNHNNVRVHDSHEHGKYINLDVEKAVYGTTTNLFNSSSGPPPLCSICQNKAPAFGKPAIRFTYAELQKATDNFSKDNFLAEGGYGPVHKGILQPSGHKVAVKQHRQASTQGNKEFCSEVEVLSCAQHRNVVMLMGYCIEEGQRMLVYEYVCNGSLDSHLFNRNNPPMEWKWRQKVAVGAARGLRFLHEDCRVGCIVHRDIRPNNILLTHDFEPQVGDFGLARCQPDGELEEETRVLGTFGYLAPEYAQTGQLTEKADVYSFGVILLELITGRKAIDYMRPKGQQCLTEWARPLMEGNVGYELVDPQLENRFSKWEAYCMLHAASLCIRRDPHARPRMSQVLKILEGELMSGTPVPFGCTFLISGSAATSGAAPGPKLPNELLSRPGAGTASGTKFPNEHSRASSKQQDFGNNLMPAMRLPPLSVSRPMLLSSRPGSSATSPSTPASFASRSPPSTSSSPAFLKYQHKQHDKPRTVRSNIPSVTYSTAQLQSVYHSRHNSRAEHSRQNSCAEQYRTFETPIKMDGAAETFSQQRP